MIKKINIIFGFYDIASVFTSPDMLNYKMYNIESQKNSNFILKPKIYILYLFEIIFLSSILLHI